MAASSSSDSEAASAAAERPQAEPWNPPMTRGGLLKTGAAVAAAGGAAATLGKAGVAQAAGGGKNKWKNRRFRGLVRASGQISVADLELIWPIDPREVLIATEGTQASYSNTQQLNVSATQSPAIAGYIGCGTVVYVGEQVRRAQVGDRVVVGVTPQCGQCYNCLHGRADMCQFLSGDAVNGLQNRPFARLVSDGREVSGGRNGFSELMVANDEWVVPVFTDLPGSALSLLGSVGATGLAAATSFVPVAPGSDVVVFGCGPIGLSMVNGAAIMGANRIIAVDPIGYRRQAALEVGATAVYNPTGKDATIVADLTELTKARTNRNYAGGRGTSTGAFKEDGPDYIFEATGAQLWDPSVRGIEPQPDPTGIRELEQIWSLCPGYGTMVWTGVRWGNFNVPILGPARMDGRRLISGQNGGSHLMRDVPRMVNMMERGQYKWEKIVTAEYPLEQSVEALRDAAYRSTISAHVVFDPAQFLE